MAMTVSKRGSRQRLIDHLPVVVFEYTFFPDGRRQFTYVSPRCQDLFGVKPEVLIRGNLPFNSFIHEEDIGSFIESVEHRVKKMKQWRWEGRWKAKDGFIWVAAEGVPVKMKDGRTVYNGIFSEITERKVLEQRYRELVEQIPLGIVVFAKGAIKFVNKEAIRMVGANSAADLIGGDPWKLIHEDSLPAVRERIGQVLKGEVAPPLEAKYVRLDGSILYVESTGHPYVYEGESAVQVIFTDITERKKKEASLKKTETLFFQLFQNTPLAVTLLNEEGKVYQINKGFEELFGFTQHELEGKSLNLFIVPDDLETEGNDLNSLISSNRVIRTETVRFRKDKTLISVIIYGVPVLLQDQTIGIFGMYVDITERKKVEEELKIRNTELDNFVYKVSHDLRAPLSSVLGLAHLASIPGNTDNLADYVKLMGQKAQQLDHFIGDVLSHSKNLKMDVKVEKVDFQKIIDQTFDDLNYLKDLEKVEKSISINAGEFYSDPWRIAEIIRNLVSNAIKYRKLGNPETFITISITANENQCTIFFQDNGIGIEKASLEKIFEMFYRASDQSEGSGLGLYIVKNAVEKLGGKVRVDSEVGRGTTFKITLPSRRPSK
jgi:PAS domain S-box-containing protein